uniref:Uncharacterized protein n=1 Tax=Panagrolaimus davidi TaxID=227884 RepID=A0A914QPU5_9BILA
MRLLYFVFFYIFLTISNAAKTTTSEPINLIVAKTTINGNSENVKGLKVATTVSIEDVFAAVKTAASKAVENNDKATTTLKPSRSNEDENVEPIKPGKATTAGKAPPNPPVDAIVTTVSSEDIIVAVKDGKATTVAALNVVGEEEPIKNGKSGKTTTGAVEINVKGGKETTTPKPLKTDEEPVKSGKATTAGKAPLNPPVDAIVTTAGIEDVIGAVESGIPIHSKAIDDEIVKNGKATTAAIENIVKGGKATTTIKPSNDEEKDIEPIKPVKDTTVGKAPPDPPVESILTTVKSGKALATTTEATKIKGGKDITTIKPDKATTKIAVVVVTTTTKAVPKTTTTTKAPKTTTTTTTTTTTPPPPASNGFLTFVRDAANIRPTFSVCGYFCNILGIKTRKKRLMDYSSLLAGLNQRDAHFKQINKADFKLAIEKNSGLLSPAIAAIQSQDLS